MLCRRILHCSVLAGIPLVLSLGSSVLSEFDCPYVALKNLFLGIVQLQPEQVLAEPRYGL